MLKKIFGVVGIILGVIGILLAIGAIVAVWMVNTPITNGALDLLNIADRALVRVDDRLGQVDDGLQGVRDFVSDTAEAIPGTQLAQRVNNVFLMVESAAEAAETANEVVSLTNKATGLFRRDVETRPMEKVATTVDNLATKLGAVDQRIKEFQDRQIVQEVAMTIDSEIAEVQDGVRGVNASVNEAQAVVEDLTVAVPRWIDLVSFLISLFFVWMGAAQLALASYGWRWLQGPPAAKEPMQEEPVEYIEEPAVEDAVPAAAMAYAATPEEEPIEEVADDTVKQEPEVTDEIVLEDLGMAEAGEEE